MTDQEAIYWLRVLEEAEIKCPDCMDMERFAYGISMALSKAISELIAKGKTALVPVGGGNYSCVECNEIIGNRHSLICPNCGRKVIDYGMKK